MRRKILLIALVSWMATLVVAPLARGQADIAVVVNQKNPTVGLSSSELRKILAGERRSWSTGLPIKLFVRAPGARERAAVLKLLGMSESEYKQYWTSQVFRGEAHSEPVALFSNSLQSQAVLIYPGAIALVSASDVKPPLRVLPLDGRMPGDPKYPLR